MKKTVDGDSMLLLEFRWTEAGCPKQRSNLDSIISLSIEMRCQQGQVERLMIRIGLIWIWMRPDLDVVLMPQWLSFGREKSPGKIIGWAEVIALILLRILIKLK